MCTKVTYNHCLEEKFIKEMPQFVKPKANYVNFTVGSFKVLESFWSSIKIIVKLINGIALQYRAVGYTSIKLVIF